MTRPGFLKRYAEYAGISHVSARKLLRRVGVNYLAPFSFAEADRLLDATRHLGHDYRRKRKVHYPDA